MDRKIITNNKGQTTLLLLLLVVGVSLGVGISISGRSLVGLDQSMHTDNATECLAAAESGVETALQELNTPNLTGVRFCNTSSLTAGNWATSPDTEVRACDIDGNVCRDFNSLRDATSDVAYCIWEVNGAFDLSNIAPDETYQIKARDLGNSSIATIRVHWTGSGVLSYAVISKQTDGTVELVGRGLFDPNLNDTCNVDGSTDRNFPTGSAPSPPNLNLGAGYRYITIAIPDKHNVDVRLRLSCASTPRLYVDGLNGGNQVTNLPVQYHRVESTCLNNEVAKTVSATRFYPGLPTMFDHVLFSASTTTPLAQ